LREKEREDPGNAERGMWNEPLYVRRGVRDKAAASRGKGKGDFGREESGGQKQE